MSTGIRRAIRACFVTLVLAAMVLSLVRTQERFYYCEAMGLLASDPCRGAANEKDESSPNVQREHHDCCAVVTLRALPRGAVHCDVSVAPAGAVHAPYFVTSTRADSIRITRSLRSSRAPPFATERIAALMVFHT